MALGRAIGMPECVTTTVTLSPSRLPRKASRSPPAMQALRPRPPWGRIVCVFRGTMDADTTKICPPFVSPESAALAMLGSSVLVALFSGSVGPPPQISTGIGGLRRQSRNDRDIRPVVLDLPPGRSRGRYLNASAPVMRSRSSVVTWSWRPRCSACSSWTSLRSMLSLDPTPVISEITACSTDRYGACLLNAQILRHRG